METPELVASAAPTQQVAPTVPAVPAPAVKQVKQVKQQRTAEVADAWTHIEKRMDEDARDESLARIKALNERGNWIFAQLDARRASK